MPSTVHVGTILMRDWPLKLQLVGVHSEPCSGNWSMVETPDGSALERKIHAAGWNFFFMAAEVKATFLGGVGPKKILSALKQILQKVNGRNFNSLEVTEVVARHFLGVPYTVVSAHSRHIQQGCYLDSARELRTSQRDAEWAKG